MTAIPKGKSIDFVVYLIVYIVYYDIIVNRLNDQQTYALAQSTIE